MKILITGGNGFVGKYISSQLNNLDHKVFSPNHFEMDCSDSGSVIRFLKDINPDLIIHTAAFIVPTDEMSGNHNEIFEKNKHLNTNILKRASESNIRDVVCFGSHTMYSEGIRKNEKNILKNDPPSFIRGYANSKRYLLEECRHYCSNGFNYKMLVLPSIYGPFDLFSPPKQMLNAVILRAIESSREKKFLDVKGDLNALREYIFLPDLTKWIIKNINLIDILPAALNLGTNSLLSVLEYYKICSKLVDIKLNLDDQSIRMQKERSSGFPLDSSLAQNFGWDVTTPIEEGIMQTIKHIQGK